MDKREMPSYYSVTPAEVRYDNRLSLGARLLYGEIACLCNAQGFCWATNAYFAELYKRTTRSISSWISSLQKAGYITITEGAEDQPRKIYLCSLPKRNNAPTPGKKPPASRKKTVAPPEENFPPPQEKNFAHNITSENTTRLINLKEIPTYSSSSSGGEGQNNNHNGGGENKKVFEKGKAPTIQAVRAYFTDQHFTANPEAFFDYNAAKGWRMGNRPVSDWMPLAHTWERREKERQASKPNWVVGRTRGKQVLTDEEKEEFAKKDAECASYLRELYAKQNEEKQRNRRVYAIR